MTIQSMHKETAQISISRGCSALGISRSGYNKWIRQDQTHYSDPEEMKLKNEIQAIAIDFPRLGYRRITIELHPRGFEVNHKVVYELMRLDNLLCIKNNLSQRQLILNTTCQSILIGKGILWQRALINYGQLISYIRLVREFIYLAVIIDVFSRKCIGWKLGRDIDAKLALAALDMALANRKDVGISNLIHHSDQGVQYASREYVDRLKENGIKISMSRKGNPYDNAFAESFIKTLKYEEVYLWEYESFDEAHKNIKKFLEVVYNKKRVHSSIGYVTPEEFEKFEGRF